MQLEMSMENEFQEELLMKDLAVQTDLHSCIRTILYEPQAAGGITL
jgi:hypothetical protein